MQYFVQGKRKKEKKGKNEFTESMSKKKNKYC